MRTLCYGNVRRSMVEHDGESKLAPNTPDPLPGLQHRNQRTKSQDSALVNCIRLFRTDNLQRSLFRAALFLGHGRSFGWLGVLELRPEFLLAEPLPFPKLLVGAIEDCTQVRRIRHQESLDLVLVLHPDNDRNRASVACHNYRSVFTGFQERAELRLHFSNRG